MLRPLAWWIMHVAGIDDANGPWYLLWSGLVPTTVVIVGVFGGAWAWWHRHNCHVHGCPLIGRLPVTVDGVEYTVCPFHHPRPGVTHEAVIAAHEASRAA